MLYGVIAGKTVVLTETGGKPVVDTGEPEAPAGYRAEGSWEDTGSQIVRLWRLAPLDGTAQEASVELARMLAGTLTDEQALMVPALYDQWDVGVEYERGDRRVYLGVLYKYISPDKTVSTQEWNPRDASSLWARVLPGQSGEVGEWVQPDSTNGYSKGDRVTHLGKTWESDYDGANVWEPGQPNSHWVEVADAQ